MKIYFLKFQIINGLVIIFWNKAVTMQNKTDAFHVPEVIRAIHTSGVPGLRFCSYLKGPIRIKYYIELPFSGNGEVTGQTIFIESYRNFEAALAKSNFDNEITRNKFIADMAARFLGEMGKYRRTPNENDLEYFIWLDELVRVTPMGALAITEEPRNAESVKFMGSSGDFSGLDFPLPPHFSETTLLHEFCQY